MGSQRLFVIRDTGQIQEFDWNALLLPAAAMGGKINGWKHILNALTVHYGDRITAINR